MRFTFIMAMLLLFVSFNANAFPKDYYTDTPVVVDIGDVSDLMVYVRTFTDAVEVSKDVPTFSVVSSTDQVSTVYQFIRKHDRRYGGDKDDGEPYNKDFDKQVAEQLTTIEVEAIKRRTDRQCRYVSVFE